MYHITDSSSSSSSNKLAFFKRTRKGKVIKLIKEKYLRTDLQCGFIHSSILSIKDLHNLVQENSKKHICIVDTNICLHEIDVLEYRSPDPLIIVILQTVLQEVKNLNLSVYKRLSVLLADETRFFIFYPNEVSSMTVADRSVGESANDFNDRRIRVASIHYQDIIGKDKGCKVVLLTHDKKNKVNKNYFYNCSCRFLYSFMCLLISPIKRRRLKVPD